MVHYRKLLFPVSNSLGWHTLLQALILPRHRRLCHFSRLPWDFAPSQTASEREKEHGGEPGKVLWLDQRCTYHFYSYPIGQNSTTWPEIKTAGKSGKCSPAGGLGRLKQVSGTHSELIRGGNIGQQVCVFAGMCVFVASLQKANVQRDLCPGSCEVLCWTFSFLEEL